MSSFAQLNLHPNIAKGLSGCGYTTPTPIQAQSIPDILNGKDLVASAQTGTGKTAAFVLPALHRLSMTGSTKKTRILILTPTRELASQITKAAHAYGKFLRFNIVSLVGGMPYHHQIRDLSRGADIIVATPGRLMDHMENKRVDLSQVEMLILDEADRMLDMGFIDDVQYIAKLTPATRQTLLFSATVDNKLTSVVRHLLKNPVRIDLSNEKIASPQVKQELYKVNNAQHKSRLLKHFLNDAAIYKAIIFSATKINADKLANQLRDEGFAAAALHGDLRQNVRNRTIEQLRRGKIQYLVATDVAARGIDISDITHVINFDLPKFCEDYVHRIGRTGRAGKSGVAISFVLPTDMRHVQRIERYIGQRLKIVHQVELSAGSSQDETFSQETKPVSKDRVRFDRPAKENDRSYRDKNTSRDKSFSRDKNASRDKGFSRDKDTSRDKSFSRDKDTSRDKGFSRDKNTSRDKGFSRDKNTLRDRDHSKTANHESRPKKKFAHKDRQTANPHEKSHAQQRPFKKRGASQGKKRWSNDETKTR